MKKQYKRNMARKVFRVFSISVILVILALTTTFFSIFFSTKLNNNNSYNSNGKILIYDNQGNKVDLPSLNSYVSYDDIDKNIINAFVALEDKRFFKHNGIDYIRLAGAFKNNIKAGYVKEGGSTITQQLAKNTQLNNKKTLERKIREAKLAIEIEERYTKEQIIEMYLNAIYFGNGIYGISQACKQFFDKKPSDIEVYEAAILAGIVKNPSKNSPLQHPENANERKNLVLRLMKDQGFIDDLQYNNSLEKVFNPIAVINNKDIFSPFYNSVIVEAGKILNISEKELKLRGIKVHTYYDQELQKVAYNAFSSKEFEYNKDGCSPDYSVLMLDNSSGGVIAYYASHNYSVFSLRRQPGSAIKPIMVYAPAFQSGKITPASLYLDKKTTFNGYSPSNHMNNYSGWIDIRKAVMQSSNVVAVKVLQETGIDYSKNIASAMGLTFEGNDKYLPLALGGMTNGVTATELSEAYMCLANGGMHTKSTFIKKIEDHSGNLLYQHTPFFNRAIDESTAYLVTDILKETSKSGTAKKLGSLPFSIASKTGTVGNNDNRQNKDAWNLSYTEDNTMCVWYGNIKNNEKNDFSITGGTYPTMLARYMYDNIKRHPGDFIAPDNIIELKIDTLALSEFKKPMLASANTPLKYQKSEVFDIDNCPNEFSPLFIMPQTNLHISTGEDLYNEISFDAQPFFKYKLIKRNLTTGHSKVICTVQNKNGRITLTDDMDMEDFGIISYSIEIDNRYCSMGVSEEKFMIVGIPITNSEKETAAKYKDIAQQGNS